MKKGLVSLASVFALSAIGSAGGPNLVSNGDFELANLGGANINGGTYWTFNNGNAGINSWTVGMTSVDIVVAPYPTFGNQALDLVGTPGPGSIEQVLATNAGDFVEVKFQLYWTGAEINREVNVYLGSQALTNLALNPANTWLSFNLTFANVEANALLRITSNANNGGNGNTFIDNVTATATPVPEPFTMALAGGALLAAARRRRK